MEMIFLTNIMFKMNCLTEGMIPYCEYYEVTDEFKTIEEECFAENITLKNLHFNNNIEHLNGVSFTACYELSEIKLPNIKSINCRMFEFCNSLSELIIPSSVTMIDSFSFFGTPKLTKIVLNEGLIKLNDYAFCESNINTIILPETLESIGNGCFTGTYIKHITIPKNVSHIGLNCFPKKCVTDK